MLVLAFIQLFFHSSVISALRDCEAGYVIKRLLVLCEIYMYLLHDSNQTDEL